MSKRVRMLTWTLNHLDLEWPDLRVLHVNQINHLSPILKKAASAEETCFFFDIRPGAAVGRMTNQDLTALTYPDNSFDLVIQSETLEHIFDPSKADREVDRVLKEGGLHLFSVPLLHNRPTRMRACRKPDGVVRHILPPSHHGLEAEHLVVWEFGGDFLRSRRGRIYRIFYDDFSANPTVFAVVERKPAASTLSF